ncbi:MAG: hypothetical protein GY704_06875, partial [Phycisphaeraceae bacterium]|nr:hypothetical protein [Phycisphaeraceae bacterium]
GSAPAKRILAHPQDDYPHSWTPDSRRILFTRVDAGGNAKCYIMPIDGSEEPVALFESEHSFGGGMPSPDGRWIAYDSDSSGDRNVYVRPFERPGNPVRVSISGGGAAQWSPDGLALYYQNEQRIMAATVRAGATIEIDTPVEVLEMDEMIFGETPLAPDGERFLTFALDRIEAVKVHDEELFVRNTEFDAKTFVAESFNGYHEGDVMGVTVRFEAPVATVIR